MGDTRLRNQLCVLAALACLQLLLPEGPWRAAGQMAANLGAAVAVHVGLRHHRPGTTLGWRALEAALVASAVSNLGWGLQLADAARWTFLLEVVPKFAVHLTLLVAAIAFLAARRPGRDRDGLLDAGIVLAAGALLLFVHWSPSGGLPTAGQAIGIAFTLLMMAVLTVGLRMAFSPEGRPASVVLLLGAAALALAGNLVLALVDGLAPRWLDPLWLVTSGLVGIAALHPSMTALTRPETAGPVRASPTRAVALGTALLTSPAVLALRSLRPEENDWALAGGMSLLTVLVLWRIARLVRARDADRNALILNQRWFRSLLRHAPDVVLVIDDDGRITYASPAITSLLGRDPTDCVGLKAVDLVCPPDLPVLHTALADVAADEPGVRAFDLRVEHSDGSIRWVDAKLSDLRAEPAVAGFVVNLREITERKALERQLTDQALRDPLTALPNRALFHHSLEQALANRNGHGTPLVVLFLDIDDFKTVNDSLGHAVGDELLQQVAQRLASCLGPTDLAARLGGDEFAILLGDAPTIQAASRVARDLVAAIGRPLVLRGLTLTMQASVGVAFASDGASAMSMLRDADVAMYKAKRLGKGQVALFDTALRSAAVRRLSLRADLPAALQGQELFLQYQPIVELSTGRTVGTEALLRWRHPELGVLRAPEFVPIAEETDLMLDIGRWVLEHACLLTHAYQVRFPERPLSVSVNLSPLQLADRRIVDDVERALQHAGLDADSLLLEVTESSLLDDTPSTNEAIHGLKELGVRLAVDDFGTGYCSLAYLQRLPVDVLKIDRLFVRDLGHGMPQAKLTKGIVQLARTLDMQIVAEGIEDGGQLAHLRRLGCDLGQGYLFAPPLTPADLDDLLANRQGEYLPA